MPQREKVGRIASGLPFRFDLLDQELDPHLPGFGGGRKIYWGVVVGALAGSWDGDTTIHGVDWAARFAAPKAVRLIHPRGRRGRISWTMVKSHCVLVSVNTGATSLDEARDIGRPAARAIVGLIRREVPVVKPAELLWEGALLPTRGKVKMTAIEFNLEPVEPIRVERLHKLGLRMAKVSAAALPLHVRRALEWLMLARAARARSEMFVHLWLAVLTLAGHGQRKHDDDMRRIARHTRSMIYGPGVTSPLSVAELNDRLRHAKKVRHDLVHRADDSGITEALLKNLESDAFRLVDFELAKLGMPISA